MSCSNLFILVVLTLCLVKIKVPQPSSWTKREWTRPISFEWLNSTQRLTETGRAVDHTWWNSMECLNRKLTNKLGINVSNVQNIIIVMTSWMKGWKRYGSLTVWSPSDPLLKALFTRTLRLRNPSTAIRELKCIEPKEEVLSICCKFICFNVIVIDKKARSLGTKIEPSRFSITTLSVKPTPYSLSTNTTKQTWIRSKLF